MTVHLLTAAAMVVRAWTWCYTLGLPADLRMSRRAEILSDVWEYAHARHARDAPLEAAGRLLVRLVLGIPDDIWWCYEQQHLPRVTLTRAAAPLVCAALSTTLVALATTSPRVDPTRALRVDVERSGWVVIGGDATRVSVVPAATLRLTNTSNVALGGMQVNALFGAPASRVAMYGFAFQWAINHGRLPRGGTSTLRLRPFRHATPSLTAPVDIPLALPESRVRLFVKYRGSWTWLGDYPIASHLIAL